MVQDHEGYLWLGTTGGIVRFDGARFTRWEAIHPAPLPAADVRALSLSRDGTLLDGFDRHRRRCHGRRAPRRQWSSVVERPAAARRGDLRRRGSQPAACGRSATARSIACAAGAWDVIRNGALGHAEVVSVREDARGSLWIGTRQGVFRTRDGESFELVAEGIARETSESADGALWMTDPAHGVRRHGARAPLTGIDGWGTRLLHDSRGNLWVGTTGQGLWRVRATAAAANAADRAGHDADRDCRATPSSRCSKIATATSGSGRCSGCTASRRSSSRRSRPARWCAPCCPTRMGSMWVGTASGLLQFRHEGGAWRGRRLGTARHPLAVSRRVGRAWAATDHGLRVDRRRLLPRHVSPTSAPPACPGPARRPPPSPRTQAGRPAWRPVCGTRDVLWAATRPAR